MLELRPGFPNFSFFSIFVVILRLKAVTHAIVKNQQSQSIIKTRKRPESEMFSIFNNFNNDLIDELSS